MYLRKANSKHSINMNYKQGILKETVRAPSFSRGSDVHLINSRAPKGLTYGFGSP